MKPSRLVTFAAETSHQAVRVFERVVLVAILGNTIVLVWGLIDHQYEPVLRAVEDCFLWFFVAELVVRLRAVGWGPRRFLSSGWNLFDTAITLLAMLPVLGVRLRVARVARVVHTLRHTSHLRLLDALRRR